MDKKINEFKEFCENNLINWDEIEKLQDIGGHKVYHREGNALVHTVLVWEKAKEVFPDDIMMQKVAALHDCGKVITSIKVDDENWEYPNHSVTGAEELGRFLHKYDPDFEVIAWYVKNHIKPLFWHKDKKCQNKCDEPIDEKCTKRNLAQLCLCDVHGSQPDPSQCDMDEQKRMISYLQQVGD